MNYNVLGYKACSCCERGKKGKKKKLSDNDPKLRTLLGCSFFNRLQVTFMNIVV